MKKTVKLGTLGDIFIGLTYHPDDVSNEGTIVLRSSNIQDGRLDFSDVVRVKCSIRDNLFVKQNDILMCSRNGSAKLVGKCALLPKSDEKMTFGAFMTIIRTEHNEYLLHFFNSNTFRNQLGSAATTTINQITRKMLDDICVPLYDNEKEHHITSKFNKIEALIYKKQQQLSKLDELVKSRFIELFSDKYQTMTLENVCEELFAGGDVKKDRLSDIKTDEYPYPIYTNGEKNNGLYGYTNIIRVKKEAVTISGRGTIGFTCLRKEAFYPAVRLIVAVPNQQFVSGCYLKHFIESKNYGGQGASIPQLTVPMIKDELIPVPPIELQEQFATFVEQVDKSKLAIQKSLEKLEILKKSLMQQYFG